MVLEQFSATLAVIATLTGIMTSMAYIPQIIRILKRKSVEDISLILFSMVFISISVWLLYGISISNWPIVMVNVVAFFGSGTIITLYFKYKKR